MAGEIISHYRILDTLGSGGMGIVYRAEDTRLGREVALKCLPAEFAGDPQMVERLLREARSASALNHPHICTIYEVDEFDGRHFISMELLEGQSLRDRISSAPMAVEEVVKIATALADALEAAHRKGIVHRDIKPGNIFLTSRGEAKVLDFGLAKFESANAGGDTRTAVSAGLTNPGMAVGTINYMSPEQARGEQVDARSDLFSLGVVLYEMLTGRPPFTGGTSAIIFDAILNHAHVPVTRYQPSAGSALQNIVDKLLEKDCRLRYQTASDLLADLRRLQRVPAPAKTGAPRSKARKAAKAIDSLAVLPFTNASGSTELDYLGEAIAEGVIDALAGLPKLRVASRSTAFRYRDHADDLQRVGKELEVRAVLGGRISRRGEQLSIRAELIDLVKDAQLWGAQYTRSEADAVEVHAEIAKGAIEKLQGASSGGSTTQAAADSQASVSGPKQASVNHEAYQLYVRGTHHAYKWNPEGLQRGIELCRQAIDLDPAYAPPYATLAISHALISVLGMGEAIHTLRQARAYARRAIELDATLAEAHAALAMANTFADFDLVSGLREGKIATELNPNSGMTRYPYAMALAGSGRIEEALEIAREGCNVDPLMTPIHYCYGLLLTYAHRFEEAEAQLLRTIDLDPTFFIARAVRVLVLAYARNKRALELAKEIMESTRLPMAELLMAQAAAFCGEADTAKQILARHKGAQPASLAYFSAAVHGALGDLDEGFAQLERARELRYGILAAAAVNPALDPFRSDPRWEPFLRSLNLLRAESAAS